MKAQEKITFLENTILGILLNEPNLITTISFDITIFKKWRPVIAEFIRQLNSGITPDIITISEAFPQNNNLLYEIGQLYKNCPGTKNYAHYLIKLIDAHQDEAILNDFNLALREINDGTPVKEAIPKIINSILGKYSGSVTPKHEYNGKEMAKLLIDEIESIQAAKDEGKDNLKTGIRKLDEVVGYFQPTDLVVVGARPAVGKTAWAISAAINMLNAGRNVGFISTEMSIKQVTFRFAAQLSNVSARRYRDGTFEGNDWDSVFVAASKLATMPLFINDKPCMTVGEIAMQCRAWNMANKLDVVFIDYITRVKPDKETNNRVNDVGEIAASMKNIARSLNIPVIALAQLNRGSENRSDKTPRMADLRDSGIIEQEADYVLLLHREVEETAQDKNLIIVEKNRHGESGIGLLVDFDKEIMRWR